MIFELWNGTIEFISMIAWGWTERAGIEEDLLILIITGVAFIISLGLSIWYTATETKTEEDGIVMQINFTLFSTVILTLIITLAIGIWPITISFITLKIAAEGLDKINEISKERAKQKRLLKEYMQNK